MSSDVQTPAFISMSPKDAEPETRTAGHFIGMMSCLASEREAETVARVNKLNKLLLVI